MTAAGVKLTAEDTSIWWGAAQIADRRDAVLMLQLREARVACDRAGLQHCLLAYDGLFVEGFDDPQISLRAQGLALLLPKLPERYR